MIVQTMPSSGQFVAVWVYSGLIWSRVLKYVDGVLCEYSTEEDDWVQSCFDKDQEGIEVMMYVKT